MTYDSRVDTHEHIRIVQSLLVGVIMDLQHRLLIHDDSKLQSPEKDAFDEFTPKLRGTTYGSDEYKGYLKSMGEALAHHYQANRHHPEHFPGGIREMNLIDLVEMLCDWIAATKRHDDGNIMRSIELNQGRFGYSDDLKAIMVNTAEALMPATGGISEFRRGLADGKKETT